MTTRSTFITAAVMLSVFSVMPAEAAKKQHVASAGNAREECIKQAMDRVNSMAPQTQTAEKNATGLDVYRSCAAGKGIRP
jgi:hypothetical protein